MSPLGIARRLLVAVPLLTGALLVVYGAIITTVVMWVLRGFRDDRTSRMESYLNWWAEHAGTPVLNWAQDR